MMYALCLLSRHSQVRGKDSERGYSQLLPLLKQYKNESVIIYGILMKMEGFFILLSSTKEVWNWVSIDVFELCSDQEHCLPCCLVGMGFLSVNIAPRRKKESNIWLLGWATTRPSWSAPLLWVWASIKYFFTQLDWNCRTMSVWLFIGTFPPPFMPITRYRVLDSHSDGA